MKLSKKKAVIIIMFVVIVFIEGYSIASYQTNTLIEKIATGNYKKGDVVVAEFRQVINVAPGKYTLSFSCTHFNSKGELEVLNRKYDALLIEVLSTKDTVGLMRLDSKIKIEKIRGNNEK